MTVYHCIDQFVKVNFMATYEKNPFFSGFRIFYWAVFYFCRYTAVQFTVPTRTVLCTGAYS